MASAIDATQPIAGTPTTLSVRNNFATAKSEITALQAGVPATWTVGSVPFATGTATLGQDNAGLFFDNANDRLGIGTAAPAAPLDVSSTLGSTAILLHNASSGATASDGMEISVGLGASYVWVYENVPLNLGTNNTQMMQIATNGNVGIGTTAPQQKLQVQGTSPVLAISDNGSGADSKTFDFASAGSAFYGRVATDNYGATGNWLVVNRTGGTINGVNFPGAGGVQIGAPTGGYKGIGNLNCTGAYVNNVVLTSDQDLKTDIEPLPACLPIVAGIEPKSFRWKPLPDVDDGFGNMIPAAAPDFTERLNRGFLAQDVFEVLGGDVTGVDLGGMVAILWQAVRELQDEVNELKGDKPSTRSRKH